MKEILKNIFWKLALGDLKGDLLWVTPSEMQSHTLEESASQILCCWKGHDLYGKDFTVRTLWKKAEDERWEGVISWSGYEGELFVEEIHFPVLERPCEEESCFFFGGKETGLISDLHKRPLLKKDRYDAAMCSALLNQKSASLYFDHRDVRHSAKYVSYEVRDSAVTLRFIHAPACGKSPEKEYELPYVNSVATFRGSWFEVAQIYKKWALKQFWVQRRRGRYNPLEKIALWVWNRGEASDVVPPVLKLQEDLGEEIPAALDWYWWHHNPYDTDYPAFWPPRDGEVSFRKAVASLNEKGIFSQVYINGLAWDPEEESYADGGNESAALMRNNELFAYEFNTYTHHKLAYMCGESPKFHDRISFQAKKLYESGLPGQYLDQIAVAAYRQCYNPSHTHGRGASAENVAGFRKLLERLLAENPNWALTSEGCNEAFMDLLEGGITCAAISSERLGLPEAMRYVPFFQAVYHENFAIFGNYAMPDAIPPWDRTWPEEDRWKVEEDWHNLFPEQFFLEVARGCVWGIQPMVCNLTEKICSEKEFAPEYEFILQTARFYHANRKWLFSGTMLSPEGFECKKKSVSFLIRTIYTKERLETARLLPVILHSLWQNDSGERVLILANYTIEAQEWKYGSLSGTLNARSYEKILLPPEMEINSY